MLSSCSSFRTYLILALATKQFNISGLQSATKHQFTHSAPPRMAEPVPSTASSLETAPAISSVTTECTDTPTSTSSPADSAAVPVVSELPHNLPSPDSSKAPVESTCPSTAVGLDPITVARPTESDTCSPREGITSCLDGKEGIDNPSAEAGSEQRKEFKERTSPNAFVGVRVLSQEIKTALEAVQKSLVKFDHDMEQVLTSLDKLHLTLLVMNLCNDSEIERAKSILDTVTEKVVQEYNLASDPLELTFKSLGSFERNVLFAEIENGPSKDRLLRMAETVRSAFINDGGFQGIDTRSFKPHLTIAKMSKMPFKVMKRHEQRTGKKKGIEPEGYSQFLGVEFGRQVITGLELLSMNQPKDEDGYYHCFKRNCFNNSL